MGSSPAAWPLISDAAHMFTDTAALGISLAAIQIGKRAVDAKRTFGYHRFEILAAAFNALLLFGVCDLHRLQSLAALSHAASRRFSSMLVIAAPSLRGESRQHEAALFWQDQSLNVKGAYLEVWSDMLGSLGVIVGAVIIWLTGWNWVDSVIAVAIGFPGLPRTWMLLRESMDILLEGVPDGVDVAEIEKALLALPGVDSVHDLHVWAISSGKPSLNVHLVSVSEETSNALFPRLLGFSRSVSTPPFDCAAGTPPPCGQASGEHRFE